MPVNKSETVNLCHACVCCICVTCGALYSTHLQEEHQIVDVPKKTGFASKRCMIRLQLRPRALEGSGPMFWFERAPHVCSG